MNILIPTLINALSLSAIFLMIALGLNIIFGVMGVVNFAHGEFLMIGAYVSYLVNKMMPTTLGFILSIPIVFIVTACIGAIIERVLMRRFYNNPINSILVTWGLSLILQQLARNIFGANNVEINTPAFLQTGIKISEDYQIPVLRVTIIILAIAATIGVYLLLNKTKLGQRIQAVVQNRKFACCLGLPIQKIDLFTFSIGSGLAGLAGIIVSLLGSIGPSTGSNYIVDSFLVVVLGGIGSLGGTILASIFMGFFSPVLEIITSVSMSKVLVLLFIVILLQMFPQGFIIRKVRSHD